MAARIIPMPVMTTPDGLLDPEVKLTVNQVCELAAVRRETVIRRIKAGVMPGAIQLEGDHHRRWMIPIGDLITAGLIDPARVADPQAMRREAEDADARTTLARLRAEVDGLRATLAAREQEVVFLRGLVTGENRGMAS